MWGGGGGLPGCDPGGLRCSVSQQLTGSSFPLPEPLNKTKPRYSRKLEMAMAYSDKKMQEEKTEVQRKKEERKEFMRKEGEKKELAAARGEVTPSTTPTKERYIGSGRSPGATARNRARLLTFP